VSGGAEPTRLGGAEPTRLGSAPGSPTIEQAADGVWLIRARPPGRTQRLSNVYLLEGSEGVTAFDSGSRGLAPWITKAASERGGIERIVLSHAHADHRGGAAALAAPVWCHPDEQADVEGDGGEHYFDYSKVRNPLVRALAPRFLSRMDGGSVRVAGTVSEGDSVEGFEVKHLPGHAPGLIGLWRATDRLAIVSDAVFLFDPFTMGGRPGPARMAPPAVRPLPDAARESIRAIIALDPAAVWVGHYGPITGDVRAQLERAAASE
jgi:glyoxylase-like metal-dependent hydrolase (beta-lactamase superfamily II)